jgi:hypothetical protein
MRFIALATATAFLGLASLAFAAEVSRPEYRAAVEPICKANTKANERILKGVRSLVRQGKLRPAGAKFLKAAAALRKTHNQLRVVPQPSADEARLAKWLSYVKLEADLFRSAGQALKAGKRNKAQRFVNKLTTNANRANAQVLAFRFRYCRFEPSKFT